MTYEQLVADAKTRITEVQPAEAVALHTDGADAVFLDVREIHEWALGRVPGAVHIPLGQLRDSVEDALPKDRDIVIYCARGNRSALAADALQKRGYSRVRSLAEGWRGWVYAGGGVED